MSQRRFVVPLVLLLATCGEDTDKDPVETGETGAPVDTADTGDLPEPDEIYTLDSLYFGDLHAHTVFSMDAFAGQTVFYTGARAEYGEEVRDIAWAADYALDTTGLDFVSFNDHAEGETPPGTIYPRGWGDHSLRDLPDNWPLYVEQVRAYDRSCENTGGVEPCLVLFPGWEYTGQESGHKNVVWKHPELVPNDRFRAWSELGDIDWLAIVQDGVDAILYNVEDDTNPDDLWAWCDAAADQLVIDNPGQADQVDYLTIVHTPSEEPVHDTDWSFTNAERLRLVEVFSKHGSSLGDAASYEQVPNHDESKAFLVKQAEWVSTGGDDLALGVVGGTDTHSSKPGNDLIEEDAVEYISNQMFFAGGLAGVVAVERGRDAIWEGLQARRTFGTSGPRIRVLLRAISGQRIAWQGEIVEAGADTNWTLKVSARSDESPWHGEAHDLARMELWQDGRAASPLCTLSFEAGAHTGEGRCDLALAAGQRSAVMAVAVLADDERAWTSPIFFE